MGVLDFFKRKSKGAGQKTQAKEVVSFDKDSCVDLRKEGESDTEIKSICTNINFQQEYTQKLYRVGQMFKLRVDGFRAVYMIVVVDKEKKRYVLECCENCEYKGKKLVADFDKFFADVYAELPSNVKDGEMER